MSQWTEMWIIFEQKKGTTNKTMLHFVAIFLACFQVNSGSAALAVTKRWIVGFLFLQSDNYWLDGQIAVLPAVKHDFHINDNVTPAQIFSSRLINNVCLCLLWDHDLGSTRGRSLCASTHSSNDGKTSTSGWTHQCFSSAWVRSWFSREIIGRGSSLSPAVIMALSYIWCVKKMAFSVKL